MKTGNNNMPRFEYPMIFDIRVAGPIDSRMTISAVDALNLELPQGVRYKGQLVWVDDRNKFYHFKTGILNSDFVELSFDSTNVGYKFVYVSTSDISNDDLLNHGLGTTDLLIQFFLDDKQVFVDFEFPDFDASDVNFSLDNIRFKLAPGQTIPAGLSAVIIH